MKNFLLFLITFFVCSSSFSQVVTGVYRGQMLSDSLKTPVDFELTLKEKDGKLYGYCHRLFIVNDVLFYNLVKVNGRIKDSVLIIEDEKSVSNNFEQSTKGIKTVFFFDLKKINDTAMVLPGEWNTSTWRNNRAIAGQLVVNRERNYLATQLYKRLEEKRLDKEMAFAEPVKPPPAVATIKPEPQNEPETIAISKTSTERQQTNQQPGIINNQPKQTLPTAPPAPVIDTPPVVINKTSNQIKETDNEPLVANNQPKQNLPVKPVVVSPPISTKDSVQQPVVKVEKPIVQPKPAVANNNKPVQSNPQPTNQTKQNPVVVQKTAPVQTKPADAIVKKDPPAVTEKPIVQPTKPKTDSIAASTTALIAEKPAPVISNPVIVKRETEIIKTVEIAQDSIVLSLYDNGEIDGDTVSVFVNNELAVSKVGLNAKAYKKTLYFKPGESLQLTLFAENLGSIPPNTGLLVIYTDTERYQINFTSTFSKSSSVMLRRKQ